MVDLIKEHEVTGVRSIFWCANVILEYFYTHVTRYIPSKFIDNVECFGVPYENGREHGFTISVRYKKWQKNYTFFNPCQYDAICLQTFEEYGDDPYPWRTLPWDKYKPAEIEYDDDFKGIDECCRKIADDIYDSVYKTAKKYERGEEIISDGYKEPVVDTEKEERRKLYNELKKEFENEDN